MYVHSSPVVGLINKSKKTTKMDQFVNQAKVLHWSLSSNKTDTDTITSGVDSILQSGGGLLQPSGTDSQVVSDKTSGGFKDDEGGSSTDDTTTKVSILSMWMSPRHFILSSTLTVYLAHTVCLIHSLST